MGFKDLKNYLHLKKQNSWGKMVPPTFVRLTGAHASTRCMPPWMWRCENHRISRSKPKNAAEFASFHGNVFPKKRTAKAPQNGCLEDDRFLLGCRLLRGENVSFRDGKLPM